MRLSWHPIKNKFDARTGHHQMLLNFHNDSQVQSVDKNHFRDTHWWNYKQAADCKVDQKHTRDSHNKTRNSLQINICISLHLSMDNCLLGVNYVIKLLRNSLKIIQSLTWNPFLRYLHRQSPYQKYHVGIKSRDLAATHQFWFCPMLATIHLIQNLTWISFQSLLLSFYEQEITIT